MSEISLRAAKTILAESGNKRIRKKASYEFLEHLEGFASEICLKAVENMKKEGRVTLMKRDMRSALQD